MSGSADRELVETRIGDALDAGDLRRAVHEGLHGFGAELLGYLVAVLHDEDAGREAFARLAERVWLDIAGFRRESSFRTWVYRLAWSAATRQLRDPYRRRGRALETSDLERLVDEVRSVTAPHLRTSVKGWAAAMRARLSPEERALLVLRVDRELPWREVAAALAGEEAALRKRYERLKVKIRDLAAREGVGGPRG